MRDHRRPRTDRRDGSAVELQLVPIRSAYLDVLPYASLDDFWSLAEASVGQYEHTVAWIDCMSRGARAGRGVFTRANWAEDGRLDVNEDRAVKALPFEFPTFPLKRLSAASFNEFYYSVHRLKKKKLRQHLSVYFYPLDAIANWNRFYGSPGMLQYQCVIPMGNERAGMRALLDDRALGTSFLPCRDQDLRRPPFSGNVSPSREPALLLRSIFPNRGEETLTSGPAGRDRARGRRRSLSGKNGRMPAAMFRSAYPRWEAFAAHKDRAGPRI